MDFFSGYFVVDDGADRNFQDDILPITASPVRAFAVASAFRVVLRIKSKVDQSIVPLAGFHNDVAAAPTISTRRASTGNIFLPPESNAAIATVTCFHPNFGLIDKHRRLNRKSLNPKARLGTA